MKALDLNGCNFGNLLVVKRVENTPSGKAQWLCRCDCGGSCVADSSILNSGHKVSCGCAAMTDLTGKRFGMLEVIIRTNNIGKKVAWTCRCDCGNPSTATTSNLLGGKSTSCGCVRTKHKGKGTLLYRTWSGIKSRCTNSKMDCWKRYGGRGIKMCDEWINDFSAFRTWALANGYKPGLTIDRIENDGNYCPENCQWITLSENVKKVRRKERAAKTSI